MNHRIPSLDGLRGIAAVAVMTYHYDLLFLPQGSLHIPKGYLAVDLFFLMSGFVMAHVYGAALTSDWRISWRRFALARVARVYPLFALTTLATVAAAALPGATPPIISFSLPALALQPFLLQQWGAIVSWNYPSWSISTEAEAYVAFVFLAGPLMAGRYPRLIAAGCVAAIAVLSLRQRGLDAFVGWIALTRTLAEFALGVLMYRAHKSGALWMRRGAGLLTLPFLAGGLLSGFDAISVAGLACLIFHGVSAKDALSRLLNCSPALRLGDWSYSIYLWHAPVHIAVAGALAAAGHPVGTLDATMARWLLVATTLAVIGVSSVSHRYFEVPMRRWIVSHT